MTTVSVISIVNLYYHRVYLSYEGVAAARLAWPDETKKPPPWRGVIFNRNSGRYGWVVPKTRDNRIA